VSVLELPTTLEEARSQAFMAYYFNQSSEEKGLGAELDGPDTLDKVEAWAWALLELLDVEVNRQRIIDALLDECHPERRGCPACELIDEVAHKFDEMLRRLDAVRLAARKAHQKRRRGRPGIKNDLRAAASVLIKFWEYRQRTHGGEEFTNVWDDQDHRLVPTSAAACFLFDELRLIDPKRPRLAEQLRDIMAPAVKGKPGPRRGRPRSKGKQTSIRC
jgi:hypothetical protein